MTSLNPVLSLGRQVTEPIVEHQGVGEKEATRRAVEMLGLVQIPEPEKRIGQHPHQLSGGMLQRVMIIIALSCSPKVLIADEPTPALGVTIRAPVLERITGFRERFVPARQRAADEVA